MKKVALLISIFFLLFVVANSLDIKKYKIKSGIIEYKIEGMSEGTETVYFDDYGIKEARYTKTVTKIMGFSTETNTITITDKDWSYSIDLNEKKGTKMANKQLKEMLDGISQKDYEEFGKKMLEQMNAKKIGNETILGKNCEVWEIGKMNSKTWNYEYVPLKVEINLMGTMTNTATKFEENVKIPADKFEVPKGITITEQESPDMNMDDILKMMQKASEEEEGN